PGRQSGARRNDAVLKLVLVDNLAVPVPAHVEPAGVLAAPVERRLVRRMGRAGGEVGHERPRRGDGLLLAHPRAALVRQVARQLVALLWTLRRFHRRGVADQGGVELVRLAGDEAVEVIEALISRPVVERPGGACLVVRHVVVLAEPGAGIAVLLERLRK